MSTITQTITTYTGTVPDKASQTPTEFNNAADSTLDWLLDSPDEYNTLATQTNTVASEVNDARSVVIGATNFLGRWVDQTGSVAIGESVWYDDGTDEYWVCVTAITDVTTKTPGTATEWKPFTINSNAGYVLLQNPTEITSPVASAEFTDLTSGYDMYEIHLFDIIPVTDAVSFFVRTSSDNGSTWDSTVGDYDYIFGTSSTTSDGEIRPFGANTVGSDTDEFGVSGVIKVFNPTNTSNYTHLSWHISFVDTGGILRSYTGAGRRLEKATVDAIQFTFSSGNIESGRFKIFGIRKNI